MVSKNALIEFAISLLAHIPKMPIQFLAVFVSEGHRKETARSVPNSLETEKTWVTRQVSAELGNSYPQCEKDASVESLPTSVSLLIARLSESLLLERLVLFSNYLRRASGMFCQLTSPGTSGSDWLRP